jgi:hypothetical protein
VSDNLKIDLDNNSSQADINKDGAQLEAQVKARKPKDKSGKSSAGQIRIEKSREDNPLITEENVPRVVLRNGDKGIGNSSGKKFTMYGKYYNQDEGGSGHQKSRIPGPGAYDIFAINAMAADWDNERELELYESIQAKRKLKSLIANRGSSKNDPDTNSKDLLEFLAFRKKCKRGISFTKQKR